MNIRDRIQENALLIILNANPHLIREIEEVTEDGLCGMTVEQFRFLRLSQTLEKEAKRHRMHAWDYQLLLAEQSGMDVSAVHEEDRRATAAALGIDDLL
ncbi:DUF6388 family protein [Pseudomonas helleri]|uniref:Uncharacterized protein n=1 Tax=Pseudomonas helleri TaxID=1608996 RepID=A0A6L5HYY7_9PSED|nr:DUF6388 family protein [Pseudomonas helleri]MQU08579.1 hypothetical protein [Pseudomonas helleri]